MTVVPTRPLRPGRRRRPSRARALARRLLRLVVVAVIFAGGVALGQALEDKPGPGPARTLVRTLKPLPVPPAPRTVTVTVER